MKYYAVIDTNVLVSATLKWKSVPGSIMDLAFNEVIVPLVNEKILREYQTFSNKTICRNTKANA
ncbi:PIN domain-containing protein [Lachnospiraceae bacterium NK3A20]|nr:PIN domain-containing protein [Lachnospiraceae bacterium NK3A20]